MKISVCGKGGSGKSTIVSLLANEARSRGYCVLVVDSDESNSGLFRMLGFDYPPVPLMELVGGKQELKQKMGQPSILSKERIRLEDISYRHIIRKGNLAQVSIGKILQSHEGCACPMGALCREFLKKLDLADNQIAIVDMEAGTEHFGRGVDASIDITLIIIEPPLESINVGQKIHHLASSMGIKNIFAVMNKVPTEEIATKLREELKQRRIDIAGCIYFDADIFNSSLQGYIPSDGIAVRDIKNIFDHIFVTNVIKNVNSHN